MTELPAITRPNGKVYRPRKLVAHAWEDQHGYAGAGAVVFGTHDENRARPLALRVCGHWYGTTSVRVIGSAWWRDGYEHGERCWVADDEAGRAGVMFEAVDL